MPDLRVLDHDVRDGFTGAVGNTPLIRLRAASERTGCRIYGKAEFLNPGGSVKDRAALWIIRQAEARGVLRPGGVVVEGTAGNTGIGLALVGNARGYRTVIVMPDTQSREKQDLLRLAGAQLRLVPAAPYSDPANYVRLSERVAAELAEAEGSALWANQWDNLANMRAHVEGTGPEIWRQTGGEVDGFVCAVGTGGTLAGVSVALKERRPDIVIACADPAGASMAAYFATGEPRESDGDSIAEGIGQGRVTANVAQARVDEAFTVPDTEALPVLFDLLRHEGLYLGGSSGVNVAGAIRLAERLGPGHTIVTILCDGGQRYQSKLYNPEYLRAQGLPTPDWL